VFLKDGGWRNAIDWLYRPGCAHRRRRVWAQFETGGQLGHAVRLGLAARLINRAARAQVRIGDETVVRGILRNERDGAMTLGARVYVGDGVILSAMASIEIGDETLIAHDVQIFDNDTHPHDAAGRVRDFRRKLGHKVQVDAPIARAPVRIGRRCWLGMRCLVMKGVTIGDETIIAGGSVVTSDLPAGIVAGGNPARPLRTLIEEAA
jgi:acetyltransferase-like isoleucine patch superfamily enzyme